MGARASAATDGRGSDSATAPSHRVLDIAARLARYTAPLAARDGGTAPHLRDYAVLPADDVHANSAARWLAQEDWASLFADDVAGREVGSHARVRDALLALLPDAPRQRFDIDEPEARLAQSLHLRQFEARAQRKFDHSGR